MVEMDPPPPLPPSPPLSRLIAMVVISEHNAEGSPLVQFQAGGFQILFFISGCRPSYIDKINFPGRAAHLIKYLAGSICIYIWTEENPAIVPVVLVWTNSCACWTSINKYVTIPLSYLYKLTSVTVLIVWTKKNCDCCTSSLQLHPPPNIYLHAPPTS